MDIKDLLSPADAIVDLRATDKANLLKELSRRAASRLSIGADLIAASVLKREALGSTGVGNGIAIPHARVEGINRPFGALVRLRKEIDFEAIDGQPVDVVFLLLLPAAPKGEQINALACVARKLRHANVLRDIRSASESAALYQAVTADSDTSNSSS